MPKILVLVLLAMCFLEAKNQNVELLANNIQKKGHVVEARGDVLVYSNKYLLTANKAIYDEKKKSLELFGNINMISEEKQNVKSEYIKLDLKQNIGDFSPFFTYNDQSDMWLDCESASSEKSFYITKNAVTSSCDIQDPDWKMGFTTGQLNKKTRFLQLYNVIFYVRNVPIFYFPFFAIPTDTTRRSGLLMPDFSFHKKEGFYYAQPLYIAEFNWWDLELVPQIRDKRGKGIYGNFRFVDTAYSNAHISFGEFKDKEKYTAEENLKNNIHKGYEIKYKNDKILEHFLQNIDDGFLLDFTYLNDVDYLNLKTKSDKNYDSLVSSKANYFIRNEQHYFGTYAKYHINTNKTENDTTIQELPNTQYHKFVDEILFENLIYSFDVQYYNYTRKNGLKAMQTEINLPISLYLKTFDDFLHFSISENLSATYVEYENDESKSHDKLLRNYHIISTFSDLVKTYESFYHTIKLKADYVLPSIDKGEIKENFIHTESEIENIKFSFIQFFYDKNNNKKIKHSLKQVMYLDDERYKYEELKNFISYYLTPKIYIKNELAYDHKRKYLSKLQTSLNIGFKNYSSNITHTKSKSDKKKESFLTAKLKANYGAGYNFFANGNYNLEEDYAKSWEIGLKKQKRCWNVSLSYKEDINPKLTQTGSDKIKLKGYYLTFELYPLGGTRYDFLKEQHIE